jgi:hypothetical protein
MKKAQEIIHIAMALAIGASVLLLAIRIGEYMQVISQPALEAM